MANQSNSASSNTAESLRASADDVRQQIEEWEKSLAIADRRMRVAVRERPLLAIAAAVAAGFVIGRVMRRV